MGQAAFAPSGYTADVSIGVHVAMDNQQRHNLQPARRGPLVMPEPYLKVEALIPIDGALSSFQNSVFQISRQETQRIYTKDGQNISRLR